MTWDEAEASVLAADNFPTAAFEALGDAMLGTPERKPDLPDALRTAILEWYQTTPAFTEAIQWAIDDDHRLRMLGL
jgi:hypothetical protein